LYAVLFAIYEEAMVVMYATRIDMERPDKKISASLTILDVANEKYVHINISNDKEVLTLKLPIEVASVIGHSIRLIADGAIETLKQKHGK